MAGLLDPLEVEGLASRNRIVMPPMQASLATVKGAVTEELIGAPLYGCSFPTDSFLSGGNSQNGWVEA